MNCIQHVSSWRGTCQIWSYEGYNLLLLKMLFADCCQAKTVEGIYISPGIGQILYQYRETYQSVEALSRVSPSQ